MTLYTSIRFIPNISQNLSYQTKPLFYWLTVIFNRVDNDRIKEVGPDRACAEWLLRNGASVRWKGFKDSLQDYNLLPSGGGYFIEAVDANNAGISYVGFPYFKGCNHIKEVKFENCKYIDNVAMSKLSILKDTLTQLEVIGCTSVENEGLRKLKILQKLETLKIKGLPAVDNSICKELSEALPKCKISCFEPK